MTQDEIMDLPKQACITRDNASISLDVLLSYKIVNPKLCLYTSQNLPLMMAKVLQAQVRAVAGTLDVDSIIEETATMDRVAGELGAVASRWGVSGEPLLLSRRRSIRRGWWGSTQLVIPRLRRLLQFLLYASNGWMPEA